MTRNLNGVPGRSIDLAARFMHDYSIEILVRYNDRVAPFATGFLIEIADRLFLVTARHAITKAFIDNSDLQLYVGSDSELGKAKLLPGKFQYCVESRWSDCNFIDVAILEIPSDFKQHLQARKKVRMYQLGRSLLNKGQYCGIYGVPRSDSKAWNAEGQDLSDFRLECTSYFTYIIDAWSGPTFNSNLHFALDGRIAAEIDNKVTSRTIAGMSGSAIWAFRGNPHREDWTPCNAELIGLQSAALPDDNPGSRQALKAIKTDVIIWMIEAIFDGMKELLDSLRPISFQIYERTD